MATKNALVTDLVHDNLIEAFQRWGWSVDYYPKMSLEDCKKVVLGYEVLVINSKIIADRSFLDLGQKLEVIARLGSGLDIIDLPYAEKKNITVINSPEGNRLAVAEHVAMMILAFYNHLLWADQDVRNMTWNREQRRGRELNEMTLGIIGYGNTGEALANVMSGFQMKILAYDKYRSGFGSQHVQEVSSADIFSADIITLHLPLTKETHHLVDKHFLEKMNPHSIIVNTSRGTIVETKALVHALMEGQIAGACLDVFENEKPQTYSKEEIDLYSQLFKMQNVVLSPHVAGWTNESKRKIADTLVSKIGKRYQLDI